MKGFYNLRLLLLSLAVFAFVSCDDDSSGPSDKNIPSVNDTFFEADWSDNVKYFDESEAGAMNSHDKEKKILAFKASSDKAMGIAVGDIIMVHGEVLAKAEKVNESGGEIIVEYSDAKLTEAIKNGKIEWDITTDFDQAEAPQLVFMDEKGATNVTMVQVSPTEFEYSGKVGAYKYTITLGVGKDELEVELSIKKKLGEYVSAEFSAAGKTKKIRSTNSIEIQENQLSKFDYNNDNIKGELTLKMEAKAEAGADDIKLNIPVVLIRYPFLVGPIPVLLTVQLDFGMSYGVPLGAKAQAKVEASFSFDSNGGFSYNGTDVDYNATAGNLSLSKKEGVTTAPSPVWAEYGVSFPYISLHILGNTVVPTFKSTFIVRGDYSPPVFTDPPCHNAYLFFAGVAGVDLNFFSINLYEKDVNLWYEKIHFLKEGCE